MNNSLEVLFVIKSYYTSDVIDIVSQDYLVEWKSMILSPL